ncbi:hypothetical protein AAG570_008319 [Ranatra chinensis]|uniref:Partial AB-hydrolase lipase domain-containing protein n=1 Tax=Ranatra chinensis TaxID=642074 RepID=A0ABD0XST5_9HEMI
MFSLEICTYKSCRFEKNINLNKFISFQPKIIKRYGYEAESHEVVTEDGYILTVHRIPSRTPETSKLPILLQHGLLDSSAGWIINGPNRSLAYQMADKGYDVWLGNARGNVYSKGHVSLSPSDQRFWNFSWHEMGYYDLPAVIDYLLNVTRSSSLYYVGHSMGTTMSYVLSSTRPEYNLKIKHLFSLAPVAFMSRATSPLRYLAPYAKNLELVTKWFGPGEFLPRNTLMNYILKYSCENSIFESKLCEHYIFIICGYDPQQFNMKLLPVILGHSPAGASTKTLVHFAQLIQSGEFAQFDYGEEENLKIYGTKEPPKYDFKKMSLPVTLYYGQNDLLANVKDVDLLYNILPNPKGMFRVNFSLFNHLDFLWSIDVNTLLNENIETIIDKGISDAFPLFTNAFSENKVFTLNVDRNNEHRMQKSKENFFYNFFGNDNNLESETKNTEYSLWNEFKEEVVMWKDSITDKLEVVKFW